MPRENIRKYAETGYVLCVSTSVPQFITSLRGGESITLKSHEGSQGSHKIGFDAALIANHGYLLDGKEKITLTLPITFGANNLINIYALPENANKYVGFIKLIGLYPQTAGSD